LYKKNQAGTKYARAVTASAWPTLMFLVLGISVFIFAAISIDLDVMITFPAEVDVDNRIVVSTSVEDFSAGTVYAYVNRNDYVAAVEIARVEEAAGRVLLHPEAASLAALARIKSAKAWSGRIYIDIPRGTETLLRRIIVRAGKSYE